MTENEKAPVVDERAKALAQAREDARKGIIAAHKDEYEALLLAAQEFYGVKPKRARALSDEQRAEREAARVAAVAARKEERRLAKVAALQAELKALLEDDDEAAVAAV